MALWLFSVHLAEVLSVGESALVLNPEIRSPAMSEDVFAYHRRKGEQ